MLKAQTKQCFDFSTPDKYCTYNLSNGLFSLDDILVSDDKGYGNGNDNWQDVKYHDDNLDGNTCIAMDGCIDNWQGTLKYNVYYPDPNNYDYASCPLKCMIFVHGGGYSDCSHYVQNGDELETLLKQVAIRGFVVYNVEYRRGRTLDPNKLNGHSLVSVQQGIIQLSRSTRYKRCYTHNYIQTNR